MVAVAESQRVKPRAFVDLDIDATRRDAGDPARLLRCTATTYEPHLQRANVRLLYDRFEAHEHAERVVTDFESHVYFPAEVEPLFAASECEIVQQFGDYQGRPFGRTSPFLITHARRRAPESPDGSEAVLMS